MLTKCGEWYFARRWVKLSKGGFCDDIGGAEYVRCLDEWLDAGRPVEITRFILDHANNPPPQPDTPIVTAWPPRPNEEDDSEIPF